MRQISLSHSTRDYSQVTVGVSCVVERDNKYLCVQEYRPGLPDHETWNIPTGLLDPGESPVQAAIRELQEETGYGGNIIGFLGVFSLVRNDLEPFYRQIPHVVKLVFVASVADEPSFTTDRDVQQVAWYSKEELKKLPIRDRHIFEMFEQYEQGVIHDVEDTVQHATRVT